MARRREWNVKLRGGGSAGASPSRRPPPRQDVAFEAILYLSSGIFVPAGVSGRSYNQGGWSVVQYLHYLLEFSSVLTCRQLEFHESLEEWSLTFAGWIILAGPARRQIRKFRKIAPEEGQALRWADEATYPLSRMTRTK